MNFYTVKFEYRPRGTTHYRQHQGDFFKGDPRLLRRSITDRLEHLGYEVGGLVVYDGDWLVIGNVLGVKK